MRILNESDIATLSQAGIRISAPLPRHNTPTSHIPAHRATTDSGEQVDLHCIWIGEDEQSAHAREYWIRVISTFSELRSEPSIQGIVQSVDLNDLCALAVEPAQPLAAGKEQNLRTHNVVEVLISVSSALLLLRSLYITPMRLSTQDVVVDNHNNYQLSAQCELSFGNDSLFGNRAEHKSSVDMLIELVAEIQAEKLCIEPQLALVEGSLRAIRERPHSEDALGEVITTLKQINLSSTENTPHHEELNDQWVHPTALVQAQRTQKKLIPQIPKPALWAAIAGIVVVSVSIASYALGLQRNTPPQAIAQQPIVQRSYINDLVYPLIVRGLVQQRYTYIAEQSAHKSDSHEPSPILHGEIADHTNTVIQSLRESATTLKNPAITFHSVDLLTQQEHTATVQAYYTVTGTLMHDKKQPYELTEHVIFEVVNKNGTWVLSTAHAQTDQ
ncbi:hypothetical protein [Timonella sp. A28]|uniref:hypothetical protein n=1 Tax=Timonella sp. A28 TaxID=3442640 RepID=UPI003EBDFD97